MFENQDMNEMEHVYSFQKFNQPDLTARKCTCGKTVKPTYIDNVGYVCPECGRGF